MSANGRVGTGFSNPWVAVYAHTGTTVSYSSTQVLARGVNVTLSPDDAGDDNIFYADNGPAERASGVFIGADITLTVDGLLDAARAVVMGLPAATATTVGTGTVNATHYGDDQSIPYVGIGYVVRYMSDGATTYVGTVLPKCKFDQISDSFSTQEEDIDWQTQELSGRVLRDDSANHEWKIVSEGLATEAEAINFVKVSLGGSI